MPRTQVQSRLVDVYVLFYESGMGLQHLFLYVANDL
jgi:hypothetical protein